MFDIKPPRPIHSRLHILLCCTMFKYYLVVYFVKQKMMINRYIIGSSPWSNDLEKLNYIRIRYFWIDYLL